MNSLGSLIIFVLSVSFFVDAQEASGDIIADTTSIVEKLCVPGSHSDEIAHKFFCCYDQAPGKQQFTNCQIKLFGNIFNTEATIDLVCQPPVKFTEYFGCLQSEFKAAGLDLVDAITKVNVCQRDIFGL